MHDKEILSAVGIALNFLAFYPFAKGIIQGSVRPHVFSWVIWGTTTFMVFLAQLDAHGGVGAWPIGVSGVMAGLIAVLAYAKRADTAVTPIDWMFFAAAMSSVPVWYLTSDPMWAVVVLTAIDLLGFGPTIRKAYAHPYSESLLFYALFVVRNGIAILALERYSVATVLFPGAIAAACLLLIWLIAYRRQGSHTRPSANADVPKTGWIEPP